MEEGNGALGSLHGSAWQGEHRMGWLHSGGQRGQSNCTLGVGENRKECAMGAARESAMMSTAVQVCPWS